MTAARALNSAPVINDFAVYAKNSVKVADRARVNGKDVGVQLAGSGPFLQTGYELGFSSQARADQSRSLLANRVLLASGSIVGDVQTSQLTDQGSTHGQVAAWVVMPAFPSTQAVSPGTANLTVNSGSTSTIGAGRYATVTVNGTLKLSGGIVQMSRLVVGDSGRIEGLAAAELRVSGRISVAARASVGPAAGRTLVARDLRIEASGRNGANGGLTETPRAVEIGNDSIIRATILAPNGSILTGQRTAITGTLAGKDVLVDLDSIVTYESGLGSAACVPADCSDGNPCTVDTCNAGTCSHANAASGTSCADATVCNGAETCNATGICIAGTPPIVNDGNPCTADSCNPTSGVAHTPVASGTSCSDANLCDGAETCNATATCVEGTPPVVDDGNPCTTDSCNPFCGVTHTPVAAGTSCSDGNACNGDETCNATKTCLAGTPLAVDDGNPCTEDSCSPASGVAHTPVATGTACPDGNPADPCITSFCNEKTSHCLRMPFDGVPCEDGDPTTTEEICVRGLCKPPSSAGASDDLYHYELIQGIPPDHIRDRDIAIYRDNKQLRMASLTRADAVEIPVVFHILENGLYPEVPAEDIYDALDIVNEDYALLKLDDIREVFQPVANATRIRFVPALRSPECDDALAEPGIHRVPVDSHEDDPEVERPEEGIFIQDDEHREEPYGTPGWPPEKYLNVWGVPIQENMAGAHIPGDDGRPTRDGVTVEPAQVGSQMSNHTLSHEIGHWLNLLHPDDDENCEAGGEYCDSKLDELCDTPTSTDSSSFCPDFANSDKKNECVDDSPVYDGDVYDQLENYMNRVTSSCRSMFTYDQVTRMDAELFEMKREVDGRVYRRNLLLGNDAAVPLPEPGEDPDLWSRDGQGDVGQEPNNVTEDIWKSTDIWVRNQDDGEEIQIHENPVYRPEDEEPNWVYVRVRNIGCEEADSKDVTLYWAKASGALRWPKPWDGTVGAPEGDALMGDVIGTQESGNIGPGESVILQFEWYPPDPVDYESFGADLAHFCLLSHIGAPPDETDNLGQLVRDSNNVVWKNVSVVTDEDLETAMIVSNMPQSVVNGIRLTDPEDLSSPASVFDWATVKVDLGTELLTRWLEGGSQGHDIDYEPSTGMIVFNTTDAEVRGLPIFEDELFAIRVLFGPLVGTQAPLVPGMDVYQLDIFQTNSGYYIPVGALRAQIKTRIPLP